MKAKDNEGKKQKKMVEELEHENNFALQFQDMVKLLVHF
jgi:hypothetical protein